MKKILGISAFYHDSAASLVVGGKIIAAAQEERFTREKHTPDFPTQAIIYCLEEAGLKIDELDAVVFYDKPLLKFERLIETYYAFSPKGLISFLKAIPVWINEKMFLKKKIYAGLKDIEKYDKKQLKLLFTEHHLSHAASAFYPSAYEKSAILTIDGVGEWCTASIGIGDGKKITFLKELNFPHSVGLLYSAFTYYLGFTVNSGEYKLMGLAPYGNPEASETKKFIEQIKTHLVEIKPDGSVWLDQAYYNYASGLRMVKEKKWEAVLGIKRRLPESELLQSHCNLAFAIQHVTEEIVILMAKEAKRITGLDSLCMAGGVALNCVANGKLLEANIFKNIYVQSASGDAGGALGAALAASHTYFEEDRVSTSFYDSMQGSYLGPDYSEKEIYSMCKKTKAVFEKVSDFSNLSARIAKEIANAQVVGWFQGRMEFGPRALGNRSILADARNPEMQKKLNLKIKYRESFRPFAPAVLADDCDMYFHMQQASPYMLFVAPILEKRRCKLPENYFEMDLMTRLYQERSKVQSITHLDFSARVQTVHRETNPRFYQLIEDFKALTGDSLLINTSFNVRGEPIVCSPYDAYRCFMSTEMDLLVINDFVFKKEAQPDWENKEKWMQQFKLD